MTEPTFALQLAKLRCNFVFISRKRPNGAAEKSQLLAELAHLSLQLDQLVLPLNFCKPALRSDEWTTQQFQVHLREITTLQGEIDLLEQQNLTDLGAVLRKPTEVMEHGLVKRSAEPPQVGKISPALLALRERKRATFDAVLAEFDQLPENSNFMTVAKTQHVAQHKPVAEHKPAPCRHEYNSTECGYGYCL